MKENSYLKIFCINIKNNFPIPAAVSFGICILAVMLFNINSLQGRYVAGPIEFLLPFIGVIFLVSVYQPEQDKEIRAVIASKKINYLSILQLRMLYSVAAVIVFMALFCQVMKINECHVTWYHLFGGISTGLFLGSIGFFTAGITDNVVIGYMCSFCYYICSMGLKTKLGVFYLFSMYAGINSGKGWMLLGSVVLIGITFVFLWKKMK